MGRVKKTKDALDRPITLGDLKSLVKALGEIVGKSVERAVNERLDLLAESQSEMSVRMTELDSKSSSMQTYLRALAKGEYLTGGPIGGALPVPIMMTDAERDEKAERDLGPGNAVR